MKVAVVGHLEWGRFARVSDVPKSGEIAHADEYWEEVAGGGAVAAMQLAKLTGTCTFLTKIGDDELGKRAVRQLEACGVEVVAAIDQSAPTKSMFVHVDKNAERTITVVGGLRLSGSDDVDWSRLEDMDAVYFVSGDAAALRYARKASSLIVTARVLPVAKEAGVVIDALVRSRSDTHERYATGDITPEPREVVVTNGRFGGETVGGHTYSAVSLSDDEIVDFYGCGDSFAAGLTYGLGQGSSIDEALRVAASSGAQAATRRGAFDIRD